MGDEGREGGHGDRHGDLPGGLPGDRREDARADLRWGSIGGLVRAAAVRYADREAVVDGRVRIDYAQLGERVERAAAACLAAGVEPGDRVAVWAPNTLD
ncbi:AMP-binding protein, partial [Streptomyces sp. NPDC059233]